MKKNMAPSSVSFSSMIVIAIVAVIIAIHYTFVVVHDFLRLSEP